MGAHKVRPLVKLLRNKNLEGTKMIQNTQQEVLEIIAEKSEAKAKMSFAKLFILGILGGLYISMGYIGYIRAAAVTNTIVGALMFPIGLVFVMLCGAELATGNMLTMAVGVYLKRVTALQLIKNWIVVLLTNFLGSIFAAYVFGHYVGLTEGFYLERTLITAVSKINDSFGVAFCSAILCNIFVCLAVWLSFSAKDFAGKILAIWSVITIFVVSGTQHVVANMFVIPAAIFANADITWKDFALNLLAVGLGNAVGGAIVVGLIYTWVYRKKA